MPATPSFWQIPDEDDPSFVVSFDARFAFVPVGPWRPSTPDGKFGSVACLPEYFYAKWDSPPFPPCELDFHTETDGQVICNSLTVKARDDARTRPEVTLAGVRNIRIGELKRRAIKLALTEARTDAKGMWLIHPTSGGKIAADDTVAIEQEAHRPHRGKKLSDAHLREVARVYREALKAGEPPTRAVMKHFHTVRANAGRWVALARARGFLGEAQAPRQAGEKKPKSTRKPKGGKGHQ